MIRTLTDSQRAELAGQFVPIRAGIDAAEVKRDVASFGSQVNLYGPSGTLLAYYRRFFRTDAEFQAFVREVITKPIGTALEGRLTWET